jgi:hypothetical protein
MYRGIPDAELMVVPGTCHGLLVEKPRNDVAGVIVGGATYLVGLVLPT